MQIQDLSEMYPLDTPQEIAMRQSTYCAGCGKTKEIGLMVCWQCFKGGKEPLKYFGGTTKAWLEKIKANQSPVNQ